MASKEDWAAAMSSEVFRNFAEIELKKETEAQKSEEVLLATAGEILDSFEKFQEKVNSSPRLKHAFKKLQNIFMTNEEYTNKVDPKFVQGVMLLNIED